MDKIEERIKNGTLIVDGGQLMTQRVGGDFVPIGHPGNNRGNIVIKYEDDDGKIKPIQGTRIAWRIHHGFWPPEGMSVVVVNKVRNDFRRENLMLVPRGKENTAIHTLSKMESEKVGNAA